MEKSRPNHGPCLADAGRALPAALLFLVLAAGCGAAHGNRPESGNGPRAGKAAGAAAELIQVPAEIDSAALEPTVIEPTVVADRDFKDPLVRINRAVFAFNDATYRYLLIPVSKGYMRTVPAPVRRSIGNFFANLRTPITLFNHLLQLEWNSLGRSFQRFAINTTMGLAGLFDPARDRYGLEREEATFEDSLIHYGAGYGIYLVLPILGPSDLRNGASRVVDQFLYPVPYLLDSPESVVVQGADSFQEFAPEAEQYETLHGEALEPYIFFRNMYLQGIHRDVAY